MKRNDTSEIKFVFGSKLPDRKSGHSIPNKVMNTFDDLLKNRELISHMLNVMTNGEINDFDFIVDHMSIGRPLITIMLGVPAKVKRKYNFDMDDLLNTHLETIRRVISTAGFPEVFTRSIQYSIL